MEQDSRQEIRSRPLSTIELLQHNVQRIQEVRADLDNPRRVMIWSELVEGTADLLKPWHDDPFREAWDARPVACWRIEDRWVPAPIAADCRVAEGIILDLMDREHLLVQRRKVSGPKRNQDQETDREPPQSGDEAAKGGKDPRPAVGPSERPQTTPEGSFGGVQADHADTDAPLMGLI